MNSAGTALETVDAPTGGATLPEGFGGTGTNLNAGTALSASHSRSGDPSGTQQFTVTLAEQGVYLFAWNITVTTTIDAFGGGTGSFSLSGGGITGASASPRPQRASDSSSASEVVVGTHTGWVSAGTVITGRVTARTNVNFNSTRVRIAGVGGNDNILKVLRLM